MLLDDLIAAVPALPRPLILLEDGAGRTGRARLAWGQQARYRIDWSDARVGDLHALQAIAAAGRRAYGVISYDLGLPPGAGRSTPPVPQPLLDFFVPEREIVLDLAAGAVVEGDVEWLDGPRPLGDRCYGVGLGTGPDGAPSPPELLDRSFTPSSFGGAVRRIQAHIASGDVYQVNLALAERFQVRRAPWDVYRRLRTINPSPWMGFADLGDWQLVSGSPELLVEVRARNRDIRGRVRARPIAGTRKKTGDQARDAQMRAELTLDEKEQAEHRMLLDLARNDVGRVAAFGSVRVTEREVIEEYSHVFHLVSEVVAALDTERSVWEVIPAVFPGGTITGAPKIRAMEVIAELEGVARGAYTGALGWLGPDGLQFNIVIRSVVMRGGTAAVQAGAGIVWDSDPDREWRESLRKGEAMRAALGVESAMHAATVP